jgi:SAM-dependent methyltransferase
MFKTAAHAGAHRAAMDAASTLRRMVFGFRLSQLLGVVAQLDVADRLRHGARSAEALATEIGADARALRRVLRALASVGVFAERPDGWFALTPLSELLRSDAAGSMRDVASLYGEPWLWQAYGHLRHSVRTGATAFERAHGANFYDYLQHHADAAHAFQRAMSGFTAGEVQAIAVACERAGMLDGARSIVDVGGGHGALLVALLQRHAALRGTVFDTAAVAAAAVQALHDAGVGARASCVAGDFFQSVPADADVYVAKSVLHNWHDEPALRILRNCRRAMHARARLLIAERVLEPGPSGAEAKLFDINMLVTAGGLERSADEYAALLQAAGLRLQQVLPTASALSVLEAVPVT